MNASSPQPDVGLASLQASRDTLTHALRNSDIANSVEGILWGGRPSSLRELRNLLEQIRSKPPGPNRISGMNAFVRTLGSRINLARMLDLLRSSFSDADDDDAAIARRSRNGRMHCIYGWTAQTLLLPSLPHPTEATVAPLEDMDAFLGYPPAEWGLSIHIWQPNPEAHGFECLKDGDGMIIEPPHSHPFDFVSYVSIGQMHQSIYRECDAAGNASNPEPPTGERGRYSTLELQRVDGIWPPHGDCRPSRLSTAEDRVLLNEGHSYFMPRDWIHDVEVEREKALRTPAITLFLSCEAVVKPPVFISHRMAQFHEDHPELKHSGTPLEVDQWMQKLDVTAAYLRGDSQTLSLGDIVRCGSSYAFMHT